MSLEELKTLENFLKKFEDPKVLNSYEKIPQLKLQSEEFLKEKQLPSFEIISVDEKVKFSCFKQFLAANYLQLFESTQKVDMLNKACEYGSFHALKIRLEMHVQQFDELKEKNSNNELLKKIFSDCEKMGNYFWTPGYIRAAQILLLIANEFSRADLKPAAGPFYDAALECVFMAKSLQNHPMSLECIEVFYQGKGIVAGNDFQFKNWEEAINHIREQGDMQLAHVEEIRKLAKDKIQNLHLELDQDNNHTRRP